MTACTKAPVPAPQTSAETQSPTGLESIPDADHSKYPSISDLSGWKNPYLVIREDGIGLVDLSNREIRLLKQEEVQAELVSLPSDAWPYGRVVLVSQAISANPSEQTKNHLRENRGLLMGTLKELKVQVQEAPQGLRGN